MNSNCVQCLLLRKHAAINSKNEHFASFHIQIQSINIFWIRTTLSLEHQDDLNNSALTESTG